jgi:hypothetical protein
LFVAILALTFGVACADDAVLVPYYSTGGGDLTFVQLINTADNVSLHFKYAYNAHDGSEECQTYDRFGTTTQNDIMLFEVSNAASVFGVTGNILPGDTTSGPVILPVTNVYGHLVVCQADGNTLLNEGSLFGQSWFTNYMTGEAFGMNAINDPNEVDLFPFVINADDTFLVSWNPDVNHGGIVDHLWYVFPVDGLDDLCYELFDLDEDVITPGVGIERVVFDNNEVPHSGSQPDIDVGCYTTPSGEVANYFLTLSDLMNTAQLASAAGTGGWTEIYYNGGWGYTWKISGTNVLGSDMATMIYEPQFTPYLSYTK